MSKPDDSSLDPDQRHAVEKNARRLLDRAEAWGKFPTPVDDILGAAKLKIAPTSAFDPAHILAYAKNKVVDVGRHLKSAISKVFGIYDAGESVIHIDDTVVEAKQTYLTFHETGHHEMPTHRKLFRIFQDCEKTLAPEVADGFEREANNFARFVLFQHDAYAKIAADFTLEIKTPMKLAKKFGASIYASTREFARTNHRACVVYVLDPIQYLDGYGAQARVRRIETSSPFEKQFGRPHDLVISLDHILGPLLPVGRKMSRPTEIVMTDLNGVSHECVAEAFDTTYNVFVLLYPVKALTGSTIVMPPALTEVEF